MGNGNGAVLRAMRKGMDAAGILEAGQRIVAADFDLQTMMLIGLAGQGEASRAHALDAVAPINAMRSHHLPALTYLLKRGAALDDAAARGKFRLLTVWQALEGTWLLLERPEVDPLHSTSDHASNYLPLKGGPPGDKARPLALLDGTLSDEQDIRPKLRWGL